MGNTSGNLFTETMVDGNTSISLQDTGHDRFRS